MADDEQQARIASVLRRVTFGASPGLAASSSQGSPQALIEALLAAEPLEPTLPELGTNDDETALRSWWVRQMAMPQAGLHERMVWFWHTHLTSSLAKADPALMYRQHKLFRSQALGNFRTLLQAVTIDAAMLSWLDGASNTADAPNENYARELMELFTLGRASGAYTETDVRNGAKALAGWWIDDDNARTVRFDADAAMQGSVTFLGARVQNAGDVIDAVCDHPACAPFVVAKLHEFLVGTPPTDARLAELAAAFAASGLEIRPLVEAIVRHESFLTGDYVRPRSGLEWYLALGKFYGVDVELNRLDELGQLPLEPPNVSGWPNPGRWISASSVFAKASAAWDHADDLPTLNSSDPVAEVLARAGLVRVSSATAAALAEARDSVEGPRELSTVLHALVACSPEFSMI